MYITLLYDFVANNILFNICVHVNLLNFGYSDLYFKNTIIQSVYFKPNRFCSNIMHKHSTILGFYRVFFKNSLKTQQTLPRTRQPKMPHTCSQLSTLPACCNLSTSWNELVNFIKLQQACYNWVCCKLSFANLLQLVGTTCRKPVDNKFGQSTCNKSVDNLQQIYRQQAVASHANASRYQLAVTSCCVNGLVAACIFGCVYIAPALQRGSFDSCHSTYSGI